MRCKERPEHAASSAGRRPSWSHALMRVGRGWRWRACARVVRVRASLFTSFHPSLLLSRSPTSTPRAATSPASTALPTAVLSSPASLLRSANSRSSATLSISRRTSRSPCRSPTLWRARTSSVALASRTKPWTVLRAARARAPPRAFEKARCRECVADSPGGAVEVVRGGRGRGGGGDCCCGVERDGDARRRSRPGEGSCELLSPRVGERDTRRARLVPGVPFVGFREGLEKWDEGTRGRVRRRAAVCRLTCASMARRARECVGSEGGVRGSATRPGSPRLVEEKMGRGGGNVQTTHFSTPARPRHRRPGAPNPATHTHTLSYSVHAKASAMNLAVSASWILVEPAAGDAAARRP